MIPKERVFLFDTTLRDGAQTAGAMFTRREKLRVCMLLDTIGVDYIEAGCPGSNTTDTELYSAAVVLNHARLTAFGLVMSTLGQRTGQPPGVDHTFNAVVDSTAAAVCLAAKASDYHVRVALQVSEYEYLQAIRQSVAAVLAAGKEALIDCEHFFDGYKNNPDYALAVAEAAHDAGAQWIVLCDTNGGALPHEVYAAVESTCQSIPGIRVGIHTHNDMGNAVTNSLAAVRAGARQIQGSLSGASWRGGNADLMSIIPTLLLNNAYADRFTTGVTAEGLRHLAQAGHAVEQLLGEHKSAGIPQTRGTSVTVQGVRSAIVSEPWLVGRASLPAVSSGHAAQGLSSSSHTACNLSPSAHLASGDGAGTRRVRAAAREPEPSTIVVRRDVAQALARFGVHWASDDAHLNSLCDALQSQLARGYVYDEADASLELFCRRRLGQLPHYFSVESFHVLVGNKPQGAVGSRETCEATVKLAVNTSTVPIWSVAAGKGPVHALHNALRQDLGDYQEFIDTIELTDYKVRVLTTGGAVMTRVLVNSCDRLTGVNWQTLGVASNIIDASLEALIDSFNVKLLRDDAPVGLSASA
ncbi:MAG: alpha-isopropylmalate synthase regulatory domain-containing protein [Pseudomonadota bacterium]